MCARLVGIRNHESRVVGLVPPSGRGHAEHCANFATALPEPVGDSVLSIYHVCVPVKIDQLRIVYYPDPVLRRKAAPVEQITDEVRDVAERMVQLMHQHRGVGLAAPQVGLSWRMFVANPTGEVEQDRVFINPVLTLSETVDVYEEGCLSLPGINADVRRPIHAVIEATDLAGETVRLESDDLPARVWQHEMDHLNGVLILDRMSEIDRTASKRAIKELEARVR